MPAFMHAFGHASGHVFRHAFRHAFRHGRWAAVGNQRERGGRRRVVAIQGGALRGKKNIKKRADGRFGGVPGGKGPQQGGEACAGRDGGFAVAVPWSRQFS